MKHSIAITAEHPRRVSRLDAGAALAAAYVLSVGVLALLRLFAAAPSVHDVAVTPARLAEGKLWLLVTSAFLVAGPWIPQLLILAVLSWRVVQFRGSVVFWLTALAGHVASTLLTYAGVGLLWLAEPPVARGLLNEPDYGISGVWSAALGAAAVGAAIGIAGRGRRPWVAVAAVLAIVLVSIFSDGLALPEHILAFVLGAAIVWLRPARSASTRDDAVAAGD